MSQRYFGDRFCWHHWRVRYLKSDEHADVVMMTLELADGRIPVLPGPVLTLLRKPLA